MNPFEAIEQIMLAVVIVGTIVSALALWQKYRSKN